MPKRNAIKVYGEDEYYHVYNRGAGRANIFMDEQDMAYFLKLVGRYLALSPVFDKSGRELPRYPDAIDVVAYCLMPNHFHMLVYLKDRDGLTRFMKSLMTAYSMYFNIKYRRSGALFEGRFLASRIDNEAYLWHVSRYIHLNPLDIDVDYASYSFSSLRQYAGEQGYDWLKKDRLVETSKEVKAYAAFVADDIDRHRVYHILRHQLAN